MKQKKVLVNVPVKNVARCNESVQKHCPIVTNVFVFPRITVFPDFRPVYVYNIVYLGNAAMLYE